MIRSSAYLKSAVAVMLLYVSLSVPAFAGQTCEATTPGPETLQKALTWRC